MKNALFFLIYFLSQNFIVFSQKITTIPFEELYGGVMKIKATIGNKTDTLNFIFDTGSSNISLDSTIAAYLDIPFVKTENLVNGIGGVHKVNKTLPLAFHLPNLTLDSLEFNINDYSVLEESFGEPIDGIIGFGFIHKYLLNVNFDSSIINVYKRGSFAKFPKQGFNLKFNLPYIPFSKIELRDAKQQATPLYLDCGAGLSLLLTEKYIKDSAFLKKTKRPIVVQIEGVSGVSQTKYTTIKELKIGPYKFKKVPTYIYYDETQLLNYPNTMGLIGNDILRRFNWWLDYSKQQIYLTPNTFYDDPFDYSYTGLSIFMIDGLVTVTEVIKNSPGDKAGFKINDIIFLIENTLITNVKTAKSFYQNERKVIKTTILRNQIPKVLFMKIQSII